MPPVCAGCATPLVARKSRDTGLCAGCVVEVDSAPTTEAGHVEHLVDCAESRIVERETARRMFRTCTSCGAWATRPRVSRWQA